MRKLAVLVLMILAVIPVAAATGGSSTTPSTFEWGTALILHSSTPRV